ncbi:MAG: DUF1801 domain-containing protein [Pseudomonadota bacterium]
MKTINSEVAAVLHAMPVEARTRLLSLRQIIFDAAERANAGDVEESPKWGEPAYRTTKGSTVRLGWKVKAPNEVTMYFICTTNLLQQFRDLYPDKFRFIGNRALLFDLTSRLPLAALRHCIALALTYHRK